ncbi:hypothetical protein [Amycolatopsis sulphurea]|nr:hypothetical protein [Amycolatopsis sulphurea]
MTQLQNPWISGGPGFPTVRRRIQQENPDRVRRLIASPAIRN